ncbi:hypothetical protein HDE80_002273 [Rhodanobacter sp. A1T4]|nr:hypothetical protein [Rhodanobacter sp. A1T4]
MRQAPYLPSHDESPKLGMREDKSGRFSIWPLPLPLSLKLACQFYRRRCLAAQHECGVCRVIGTNYAN